MLTLFLYCFLLGCGLQEPGPLGGTDGLEPPPGSPPGSTPTAPPPPLPPVLGDGPFPNAPADAAWIAVHDAEWSLAPVSNQRNEADNGSGLGTWGNASNVSLLDVPAAPWHASAGRAISLKLPEGMPGGGSGAWVSQHRSAFGREGPLAFPRDRTDGSIYVGMWIRHRGSAGRPYTPLGAYPVGRLAEANVAQKWIYLKSSGIPDSMAFAHIMLGFVNLGAPGAEVRRLFPNWHPQFRDSPGAVGCQSTSQGGDGSAQAGFNDENWHLVEYLILPNTADRDGRPFRNGVARLWVDGRLIMDRRDLINYCSRQFSRAGVLEWPISEISLEPIYGGGTWPVPYDLFLDYGRMKIMYRQR